MKRTSSFHLTLLLLLAFTACENYSVSTGEEPEAPKSSDKLVILVPEQADYSYSHLCFAIYDMSGKRLRQTNQSVDDTKLGSCAYRLDSGTYQLVVLAHSCDKNPAMTNPEDIRFNNSQGYTETFLYYDVIDPADADTIHANLQRVVTCLPVISTDGRTADVNKVRMTFAAGGKAFNPTTGLATVNTGSVSTVGNSATVGTSSTSKGYVFLYTDEQTMNVTIETLDADGNTIYSKTVENVPFKRNRITKLTGAIYGASAEAGSFQVNTTWLDEEDPIAF